MSKRTSIILFLASLMLTAFSVGVGIYSHKARYTPPGRVIKLPPAEINGVAVYRGADTVVKFEFDKNHNVWRFAAPAKGIAGGTADRAVCEELLHFAMRAEHRAAKVSLPQAGLDKLENVLQIVYYAGDKNTAVYLGGVSPDGQNRYFVTDNFMEQPLMAPEAMFRVFTRDPESCRTKDIFDIKGRGPESIDIAAAGSKEIAVRDSNDGWVIAKPFSWPADNEVIGSLQQLFLLTRAEAILDALPAAAGKPAVTVGLKYGGDVQTVNFYLAGEEAYAIREGRNEVYRIDAGIVKELQQPQLCEILRRRTLDLIAGRQVAAVQLRNNEQQVLELKLEDGRWQAHSGADFAIDKNAVSALLDLCRALPLNRVAAEKYDPALLAGQKFSAAAVLSDPAGGQICEVKLSGVPGAGENMPPVFYAQVSGRPQMLELHPGAAMLLLQPFLAYRDRRLLNLDYAAIRRLRVERYIDNNAVAEYERVDDTRFKRVLPKARSMTEQAGWEFVAMLRQLAQLRCEGYIVGKKDNLPVYGLDQSMLKTILTLQVEPGVSRTVELTVGRRLSLGDKPGQRSFYSAVLSDDPYIFVIDEKLVDRILADY